MTIRRDDFREVAPTSDELVAYRRRRPAYGQPDRFPDYDARPWGEQQEQIDWLETRYDDDVAAERAFYDGPEED